MITLTNPYSDAKMKEDFCKILRNHDMKSVPYIEKFKKKFLKLYDLKYGICLNSCTNALIVILHSLGIKNNDQVAVPAYTCKVILDALKLFNIKPIFIDNYLDYKNSDFNLDENDLIKKIVPQTKAIILPYMFGKIHYYRKIRELNIPIIEDITLSLGAKIPSIDESRIIICSFHSSKMISSFEGGIIAINNKKLYNQIAITNNIPLLNEAERTKTKAQIFFNQSFSFRPSELNFIWGYLQIKQLNNFIKKRQEIAKIYIKRLDKNKYLLPKFNQKNIYYRFIIGVKKYNILKLLEYLSKNGVEGGRGVYPLLTDYQNKRKILVNAQKAISMSLSVPLYPSLTEFEINKIIDILNKYEE